MDPGPLTTVVNGPRILLHGGLFTILHRRSTSARSMCQPRAVRSPSVAGAGRKLWNALPATQNTGNCAQFKNILKDIFIFKLTFMFYMT